MYAMANSESPIEASKKSVSNYMLYLIIIVFFILGMVFVYEKMTDKGNIDYACGSESNDFGRQLLKSEGLDICPISTQKLDCESTFIAALNKMAEQSPEWKKAIKEMNMQDYEVVRVDFKYQEDNKHLEFFKPSPGSNYQRVPIGLCKVSTVESYLAMRGS